MDTLDKAWHLAKTEDEITVTEFELQLWRVFYGFVRWQEGCEHSVNGTDLTANDLAVLHIVRMKDRPKSIYDIGRLLNREDSYNIYYSIRRLLKMGLIENVKTPNKKTQVYRTTEAGIQNTDAYTHARKTILINMFTKQSDLNFEEVTKALIKLKAIYDEADRVAASYVASNNDIVKKN